MNKEELRSLQILALKKSALPDQVEELRAAFLADSLVKGAKEKGISKEMLKRALSIILIGLTDDIEVGINKDGNTELKLNNPTETAADPAKSKLH